MQPPRDPPGGPAPDRARRARRRARLLPRDLPGERARRARRPRRVRPGQPLALGARACCAACTSSPGRPSWCAARAGRSSTWSWTSGRARRRSGAGRRFELDDETPPPAVRARTASRTASACSPRSPTWSTRCSTYYDPAAESGFRFDDPEVGIEWPDGHRARGLGARPRGAAAERAQPRAALGRSARSSASSTSP